jgi:hypothetical protein
MSRPSGSRQIRTERICAAPGRITEIADQLMAAVIVDGCGSAPAIGRGLQEAIN